MTRPASVRLPEDAQRGARFDQYVVGSRTGALHFVLEPDFVREYIEVTGIDASLYRFGGRPAAPPQILTLFLMGTLHRRYPPLPGIVMAGLSLALHAPLWRDEPTPIVSEGEILAKDERRGRRFVTWRAQYARERGAALATITNTFLLPEPA
jgi:hypothetical protein